MSRIIITHARIYCEQARKRADIDKRLQAQLAEETDNVRRAEELKRDRQGANRKEEDLKLRETIVSTSLSPPSRLATYVTWQYRSRRTRLPALAHFLLTSDTICPEDSESFPRPASVNPLAAPPRTHPPPLCYLPAILTPAQSAFIEKRKAEVWHAPILTHILTG